MTQITLKLLELYLHPSELNIEHPQTIPQLNHPNSLTPYKPPELPNPRIYHLTSLTPDFNPHLGLHHLMCLCV